MPKASGSRRCSLGSVTAAGVPARQLIAEGRVTVNGEVAVLGRRVDVERDLVAVDGAPVGVLPGLVYYLLNKPAGVVTTADDPQGRPSVLEPRACDAPRLLGRTPRPPDRGTARADQRRRLSRSCWRTHALVWRRSTSPSSGASRALGALRRLRQGVLLDDGETTGPARVAAVSPGVIRIVIHEGRNRQVRRMCEAVGHPVVRLVRIRIGPVTDRSLPPGAWRPLEASEVRSLAEAALRSPSKR